MKIADTRFIEAVEALGVDLYVGDFGVYEVTHYQTEADGEWHASSQLSVGDDFYALKTVSGNVVLAGSA